jgi:hypothetical protein
MTPRRDVGITVVAVPKRTSLKKKRRCQPMYFHVSGRPRQTAATLKHCTLCNAPLPVADGAAQAVGSLCSSCARPVRLGGPRPNVAGNVAAQAATAGVRGSR